jgi:hypothetical protein
MKLEPQEQKKQTKKRKHESTSTSSNLFFNHPDEFPSTEKIDSPNYKKS